MHRSWTRRPRHRPRARGRAILLAAAAELACASPSPAPTPGLVWIGEVDPQVREDIRYATARNFVGRPIDGYEAARCLLTPAAARALAKARSALESLGYGLVVYDCYRPERAVADFVRWARDRDDVRTKAEHYPDVPKEELFSRGYIAERSGHSRGSTVDLGLLGRVGEPSGERWLPIDMGTPYDFFDPRSHTDARVSPEARRHRDLLRAAMTEAGFRNLPEEWWHFTLVDEPYPDETFDVPVR
jgi:D-alanyl-D-alanine dipeptidase